MQLMLLAASGLVFSVGIPLLFLTEQTEIYFAWTIQSALTTAFLGAAYWSSCALEFMAARDRLWANGRIAVPAVIVFTGLTFIVTMLHLDRFHFNAPSLLTRAGTWVWLAVYASVPLIMSVLLVLQLRQPGDDPPRALPLPAWMRIILSLNATVMILLGIGLLVAPNAIAPIWPWPLTELTGRAVGAWLIGLGIAAGHSVWENDLIRIRPALISSIVFSILQFVALARYPGEANWSSPSIWIFILFLVNFLIAGLYGTLALRGADQSVNTAQKSVR
jgi:hypothetical protein